MNNVLISIIVPVYNAEKYLDRCVFSLVNQTYRNIEIILVDDGSTDNSAKMCDDWINRDTRIKVIHVENGGVSRARNIGIETANGDYILFCDSDDYYDISSCDLLSKEVNDKDIDLVIFSFNYVNGEIINPTIINLEEKKYDRQFIKNELIPNYINLTESDKYLIQPYSVNKLYKTSILKMYNIKFDESRRTWEDKPFVVTYLNYSRSFCFVNKTFYNYVNISSSLSRQFDYNIFNIIVENYLLYKRLFFKEYDFNNDNINNYYYHVIKSKIFESIQNNKFKKELLKDILSNDEIKKWVSFNTSISIFDYIIKKSNNFNIIIFTISMEFKICKSINYIKKCINRIKRVLSPLVRK